MSVPRCLGPVLLLALASCATGGTAGVPPSPPPARSPAPTAAPAPSVAAEGTVRPATAADVASAAAAAVLSVGEHALRLAVTGAEAVATLAAWLATEGPDLAGEAVVRAVCGVERPPGPHASSVHRVPGPDGEGSGTLVVDARWGDARAPVRVEMRPAADDADRIDVAVWAGGWLLCSADGAAVSVDGRPVESVPGWPEELVADVGVHATAGDDPGTPGAGPVLLAGPAEPAAALSGDEDAPRPVPVTADELRRALRPTVAAEPAAERERAGVVVRLTLPAAVVRAALEGELGIRYAGDEVTLRPGDHAEVRAWLEALPTRR